MDDRILSGCVTNKWTIESLRCQDDFLKHLDEFIEILKERRKLFDCDTQILLFQAEDDYFVSNERINLLIERSQELEDENCELIEHHFYPNVHHELMMENDEVFGDLMAKVIQHLDS